MREEDILVSMEIISNAGNAKSTTIMAVEEAKEGNIEKAREMLAQAKEEMHEAHASQTNLITQEMNGNPVAINILLIHSQDHLMTTMMYHKIAENTVDMWEAIHRK